MRKFKNILKILDKVSVTNAKLKKIYFLGSTGAGKTSIIKNILGTNEYSFPNISQSRTTVVPTEYVISKKFSDYKSIIIFKTKQEIKNSIEDIVREAILEEDIEDIKDKLRERGDERFKLYYLVDEAYFLKIADELSKINIENDMKIEEIVDKLLKQVETNFKQLIKDYELFNDEDQPYIVNKTNKKEFIEFNQLIFKNNYLSISILCEYIRIEANLKSDFMEDDFILIDGEGIGHSLKEKRDSLSIRHFDFFNYSNLILLVEKADDPFISGGQGAIESIVLNGYSEKLKIAFSRVDKIEVKDKSRYIKRRLDNLKDALKDNKINFNLKDIYKFESLHNKKVSDITQKELKKFQKDINESVKLEEKCIEYNFDDFLLSLDLDSFILEFKSKIEQEHWMRIKAFSKRMMQGEEEYLYIKPILWILNFFMKEFNIFLDKVDEPTAEILYSKDMIKQKISKKLIAKFQKEFVLDNLNIWKNAYFETGQGSHKRRVEWIFKYILEKVLPTHESNEYKILVNSLKQIVIGSGAKEKKKPKSIKIKNVDIQKIYHKKDMQWELNQNVNILIGKNGSGKSTVSKLIYAFLTNNQEIIERYEFPAISLDILKIYDDNTKEHTIIDRANDTIMDIVYIDTLDKKVKKDNVSSLDSELSDLVQELGKYQRKLNIGFDKRTKDISVKIKSILENIQNATTDELQEFKELKTQEEKIKKEIFFKLFFFKEIIDGFFKDTKKSIILDNENNPLIIKYKDEDLDYTLLSSGEKQLLILFLNILLAKDNSVIIMDEPELSLHVNWQLKLIDSFLKLNDTIQYLIVTHNPNLVLNRYSSEISIIKNDEIQNYKNSSKYMDISTILIDVFGIRSLVGRDMENLIEEYSQLQIQDKLDELQEKRIQEIKDILDNSFVGDFLYNNTYFEFLKFMKNKDINIKKIDQEELKKYMKEFEDFFND